MALEAEVWVDMVTEGGRRFMAAWRKEAVDAARHRQETREANETIDGKVGTVQGGESTIAPTTRFLIWTRLSRREVRASRRLYAEGGSCLRDLWRAWRIRDCGSARCS